LRINTVGFEDRSATVEEMDVMKSMVSQAMQEGALGIGSSLIYAPAFFSSTEELIEICKVAAQYDGMYISHIRNESNLVLESIDELIRIAKEANIRAEIYHLKQAGQENWGKLDSIIQKVEKARADGLHITADMYTYTAAATGLDAVMPPWVQEGGYKQWVKRLQDPLIRQKVIAEMQLPVTDWENLLKLAGSADKVLLTSFKNNDLKHLTGKSLAEVAEMRNQSPEETAIDMVIEDGSRVGTVYFLMLEENIKKQIAIPWMSFGSDEASTAPEGVFLKSSAHPRAYGNFSRLLAKYVRDEKIITLEQAIHKMTGLPASNLKIKKRVKLAAGYFADVVIFNPDEIQDHATFDNPLQYSTGMSHVFVNGVQVLRDGEHTGEKPGQVVRGPGWIE
jgi:N-acyl-D-amino-acid deacylase